MAYTITSAELDALASIAAGSVLEGAAASIADAYHAELCIGGFLDSETAHNGLRVVIQVSPETSGDQYWYDFRELLILAGTSNAEAIQNNPLTSGSTSVTLTSTTGYTTTGWRGIKDGTLANSEFVYQISNGSGVIGLTDGTINSHVQSTNMYSLAQKRIVELPREKRVRVIYDNAYHAAGSSCVVAARLSRVTAL